MKRLTIETISETTSRVLKKIRHDKRLSQPELAEILKVSKSTMSNYERGVGSLSSETLINIYEAFKITPNVVLGIEPLEPDKLTKSENAYLKVLRKFDSSERDILYDQITGWLAAKEKRMDEYEYNEKNQNTY